MDGWLAGVGVVGRLVWWLVVWLVGGWCPRAVGEGLAVSVTSEASNILLDIIGVLVLSVYLLKNMLIDVSGVQSWKLLRHLGTGCQVGLGTSSRILRPSPAFFVVSRIFAVI